MAPPSRSPWWHGPDVDTPPSRLRELFTIERPPPATAATRRLRALIALTALATVIVELLNLGYSDEGNVALAVRTGWALLRAVGFLFLMRAVRYGRAVARPFGLILTVTTEFAVVRLVVPRTGGLLPRLPVLTGFLILTVLCGLVMYQLYGSEAIAAHLSRRPPRRHVPPWALTVRIAALSYSALLLIPCLIAAASLFGDHRIDRALATPLIVAWFGIAFAVGFVVPVVSLFAIYGKRWARALVGLISVIVLVVQPALCLALLGFDSLVRDGGPLIVTATLALYGLWRTRRAAGSGTP
jgi:hypothetical protein